MKLSWYLNRLSKMSPTEIFHRGRDRWLQFAWRRYQVRQMDLDRLPVPQIAAGCPVPLPKAARGQVSAVARERLLQAAKGLLEGRWPVFDRERTDMATVPDWFWDPRTGRRAPQAEYAFRINHRHEDEIGNIKYIWELSRHHHLTVLAAAYFLTDDQRYAEMVRRHLVSWWNDNPFLSGVHWTSGIEIGLRLLAWVWIRRLLNGWPDAGRLFEENPTFLRQLYHHQHYLSQFHSPGTSANNHLLAELAGQFTASCAFPYFAESARWRDHAAAELVREIPRQTFEEGLNRELATGYHGFVLEFCLAAALEGEATGYSLGAPVWDTFRRMFDALASIVDVNNQPPRQGDDDDGIGLLLDGPTYNRWAALLHTGARLFTPGDWWNEFSRDDVRTPLFAALIGTPVPTATPTPPARPAREINHFREAGLVILRSRRGTPQEIWCRCDHGPHGFLAIAAHAHADALSVEVRHGGVPILCDPGTYCYHGEPQFRNFFRSTIAHNTLELAGTEQSVTNGPFLWTQHAGGHLERLAGLDEGEVAEWTAVHDGYHRLSPPITHRRQVSLRRLQHCIEIVDFVDIAAMVPCRLAFHLGPEVRCELDEASSVAELEWNVGDKTEKAVMQLPVSLNWASVRGQLDPPQGWYSPSFDRIVPSIALVGTGGIEAADPLRTVLRFASQPHRKMPRPQASETHP